MKVIMVIGVGFFVVISIYLLQENARKSLTYMENIRVKK